MSVLDYSRSASDRLSVRASFVAFQVSDGGKSWPAAGALRVPEGGAGKKPAVVILHGSNGVDSRGESAARALNAAGIATLEVDLWAAHGVAGPETRPKSPFETVPDVFAALAFLSARAEIDAARIGIMGFSWGGVMSMLAATEAVQARYAAPGTRFAAFAPYYPVAWIYNVVPGFEFRALTGPVLIQLGEADRYDEPGTGPALLAGLDEADRARVTLHVHAGATHAFDRREADIVVNDPFSHKGKGGETPFTYDAATARRASEAMVAFFAGHLKAGAAAAPAAGTPRKLPFSEAVRVGDVLYLSGQLGLDYASGRLVEGGTAAEAHQTMRNIAATLAKHGLTLDDVFKCTVMLADMSEWAAFNEVYLTYFKSAALPARSAFGASGLALGARLEVECMARSGGG